MDRIDPFTTLTLVGEKRIAAQVDYQICAHCGFRLMRVETTIINAQRLTAKHCPICERLNSEHPDDTVTMSDAQRLSYFDLWLATHGLDRDILSQHYHLSIDHFFEPLE